MTGAGVAPNYRCASCCAHLCDCTDAQWRGEQPPSSGIPPLGDTSGAGPHRPAPFSSQVPA